MACYARQRGQAILFLKWVAYQFSRTMERRDESEGRGAAFGASAGNTRLQLHVMDRVASRAAERIEAGGQSEANLAKLAGRQGWQIQPTHGRCPVEKDFIRVGKNFGVKFQARNNFSGDVMTQNTGSVQFRVNRLTRGFEVWPLQKREFIFYPGETVRAVNLGERIETAPEQKFFALGVNVFGRHSLRAGPALGGTAFRPFAPKQFYLIVGENHGI
jgi:hypothetical protein